MKRIVNIFQIIKEFYSWVSLELTSNYFSHSLSLASPPPKKITEIIVVLRGNVVSSMNCRHLRKYVA